MKWMRTAGTKKGGMNKLFVLTTLLILIPMVALAGNKKDALGMMEVVFKGNYSRLQIKTSLDTAMRLYTMPITEENYNKAGSVLVVLRKDTGIYEMKILNHMIRSYVADVNVTFAEVAALSVTFLEMGDM